jgi:hypothetical protein
VNMIVHFAELYYTHERTPKESHQGMWTTKVFLLQKTFESGLFIVWLHQTESCCFFCSLLLTRFWIWVISSYIRSISDPA